jgi:hypothetical protein
MISQNEIAILWPWEIKTRLNGPAVMFDVVAASYNIIDLLGREEPPEHLYLTTKDGVLSALAQFPLAKLLGEIDDPILYQRLKDKFVSSNSPEEIKKTSVAGNDAILITNNGTHTLVELIGHGASPVYVGHFVNIRALVSHLKNFHEHEQITLVPSGGREKIFEKNPNLGEDLVAAEACRDLLSGSERSLSDDVMLARESIARDYEGYLPKPKTLDLVFQLQDYSVVPQCTKVGEGIIRVTDSLKPE